MKVAKLNGKLLTNIKSKTILGGNTQEKIVTPSTERQVITADSGYTCLDKVNVEAVTSAIDSNIKPENIKKDVEILGVIGTLVGGNSSIDSGTIAVDINSTIITISGLKSKPRIIYFIATPDSYSRNSMIDTMGYVRKGYNYVIVTRRSSSLQNNQLSTNRFYNSYEELKNSSVSAYNSSMAYENGNFYIKRSNDTASTFGFSSEYDYIILY